MKRRVRLSVFVAILAPAFAGCDYSSTTPPPLPPNFNNVSTTSPSATGADEAASASASVSNAVSDDRKTAILQSVMNLIQTAALRPGGDNFKQATEKLNDYFDGTPSYEYKLKSIVREFLRETKAPPGLGQDLERISFELPDARHLEDCMLYSLIATRIAGTGDDLTRVSRVFDWTVRQVQLVVLGSLASLNLDHVPARPYDVLLRGLAFEGPGGWSERGWVFLSLCRQLGLDAGILTFSPKGKKDISPWLVGVLIDKKIYLFDPAMGLPIPGPSGTGVATLDDAFTNPAVLARLNISGQPPYPVTREDLLTSATKIGVLLDSSPGYLAPRMSMLQNSLSGKDRTVLYRDPVEQHARFAESLGARAGEISLWTLPLMVHTRLFVDPKFVESTGRTLYLFNRELPLLYARVKQLRGDIPDAITDYMKFRFSESGFKMNGKDRIPREEQDALDMNSTYFLALAHLEKGNLKQAELFFRAALQLLPEPAVRQPYYNMFRWGAQGNLARLLENRGDDAGAIAYYTATDPTPQHHGNLLRARDLVWRNPTQAPTAPLPPPPPPTPLPEFVPQPPAEKPPAK